MKPLVVVSDSEYYAAALKFIGICVLVGLFAGVCIVAGISQKLALLTICVCAAAVAATLTARVGVLQAATRSTGFSHTLAVVLYPFFLIVCPGLVGLYIMLYQGLWMMAASWWKYSWPQSFVSCFFAMLLCFLGWKLLKHAEAFGFTVKGVLHYQIHLVA